MRPNHQRRQRGRNGKPNKFPNRNQSYDSNGPDVRVRGTAHQIFEKYQTLAREAATSGDRVLAEAYYQHAEHYFRIIQAQGGFVQPRYPQPWEDAEAGDEASQGAGDGGEGALVGGGGDPADGPQPAIDYPPRAPGFAPAEDYQAAREGGYSNGEDRYQGRDGRGEGRDGRDGRYEQRRQRDEEGGFAPRGRRDFVTRGEQRFQDRQERQDRPERLERAPPPDGEPAAPAGNALPNALPPAELAPADVREAAASPEGTPPEDASAGGRGAREGRSFRPRHPHFRRFRGGPRGQNGGDPAQQDQPDLTGGDSGNRGGGK